MTTYLILPKSDAVGLAELDRLRSLEDAGEHSVAFLINTNVQLDWDGTHEALCDHVEEVFPDGAVVAQVETMTLMPGSD